MKSVFVIIGLLVNILLACQSSNEKKLTPKGLAYESHPQKSELLFLKADVIGIEAGEQLDLNLHLSNLSEDDIKINEIIISTSAGLRSSPVKGMENEVLLPGKKDTIISLTFHPLNDLKLFQLTGRRGLLQPQYDVNLSYNKKGETKAQLMKLRATLASEKFIQYELTHKKEVEAYVFNTENSFAENQRNYLQQLNLSGQSPFVYISEQEIAVSGLNFRLKSFSKEDTLHAQLILINHSSFSIKLDTADFGVNSNGQLSGFKSIRIEKISGSRKEYDIIRKGDRVIIHLKQNLPKDGNTKNMELAIKNSFTLGSGKQLFYNDIELLKKSVNMN